MQPPFDRATTEIARHLAALHHGRVVVGGGETTAAVRQAGIADQFWYVSTGGGAALQLLSGKALPGLEALQAAAERRPLPQLAGIRPGRDTTARSAGVTRRP